MNILWAINTVMPELSAELGISSGHAISWVDAMSKRLSKRNDLNLTIVTKGAVNTPLKRAIKGIMYYVLPLNCNKYDYWYSILQEVCPDIIHIYGTENDQNRLLIKNYSNSYPIVISLQGIVSEYYKHYYGSISHLTMLRFTTLRDLIRPSGFFSGKQKMKSFALNEQWILNNIKYVEGRSNWDKASALNINPNLLYYYCPRMIRDSFFNYHWKLDDIERFSIFVHQGHYPIKGLHFVLEALYKLKYKYPQVKLYVSGSDSLHPKNRLKRLFPTGYTKYLNHLIKKYELANNIIFTGYLNADQLAYKLSKTHVIVIPSAIENAPNSLAEAEIVGAPIVATFVGGNMDMLTHNEDGFLYCYNEPNMLASYIDKIFQSDELALKFSKNASEKARFRHNPDDLECRLLNIYKLFNSFLFFLYNKTSHYDIKNDKAYVTLNYFLKIIRIPLDLF